MKAYLHTQSGLLIVNAMLALSVIFAALGLFVLKALFVVVPLLLLTGWVFHSLTIEIGDGELRWWFGAGLVRKRVAVAEVVAARVVRTNSLEGWGIHWSRFGWLYNVSGYDAVAITLRNGKTFALGTDQPVALAAAINESLR